MSDDQTSSIESQLPAESGSVVKSTCSSPVPQHQSIQIFARVRPRKSNPRITTASGNSKVVIDSPEPGENGSPQLHFHIPKDQTVGVINNTKDQFGFRFDRVFDDKATQEEVFDHVAKDVILSVLNGFNATIFAYGQTGSGKTFTITGGAERYSDRGLIPRTVQFIFAELNKRPQVKFEIGVSYLEIYNENGYDLLDDSRDAKRLEDLPKVVLRETDDQQVHLQNLSCHVTNTEEDALNWLFTGDTNKMISETPSNPSSSRSHCVFILSITSRSEGSDTIRRSKLHLVDLAGSERVAKTGIDGILLKEAKSINLSLHFLEHVIVALHEKSIGKRTHIPYRNSMMTSILRDSLGGNCKTSMIATLATEEQLLEESISTCRFAQRVALISNKITVNEEIDPFMVINRLKLQIQQLKAELALSRGDSSLDEDLPEYEIKHVEEYMRAYVNGDDSAILFTDYRKVVLGFAFLRKWINSGSGSISGAKNVADITGPNDEIHISGGEVEKLERLVAQRDTEISVLIPMLNQYKARISQLEKTLPPHSISTHTNQTNGLDQRSDSVYSSSSSLLSIAPTLSTNTTHDSHLLTEGPSHASTNIRPTSPSIVLTEARKSQLLELFKQTYTPMQRIENQKLTLKDQYSKAKDLGHQAHQLRNEIKKAKDKLSCLRDNFDSNTLPSSSAASCLDLIEAEEVKLRTCIASKTSTYKAIFQQLKQLKIEIEHQQHLLDNAKIQFHRDFNAWVYSECKHEQSSTNNQDGHLVPRTPPSANLNVESVNGPQSSQSRPKSSTATQPVISGHSQSESSLRLHNRHLRPSSSLGSQSQVAADIAAFYAASASSGNKLKHCIKD